MYDFIVNRDTYIFYLKTAKYCLFCGAMIVFVIARQFCCSLLFHDYFTIFRRCFISFLYRQFLSCLSDCTALPQYTILTAPFPRSAFLLDSRLYTAVSKVLAQYPVLSPPLCTCCRPLSFLPMQKGRRRRACPCSLHSLFQRMDSVFFFWSFPRWFLSSCLLPRLFLFAALVPPGSLRPLSRYLLLYLLRGQHLLSLPPARRRSQSCPCGRYRSRWTE